MNLLIADDHALFRRGLADFLADYPEYKVVAEASNGKEVLDYLGTSDVDIALLDVNMPVHDGFELLGAIRYQGKQTKVIMLTMYDEALYARHAFELGADGYLLKDDTEEQIIACLNKVSNGEQYCSLSSVEDLGTIERHETLSPTEKRVLDLVGAGKSSFEISDMLSVSVRTIDNHRSHIAAKLGLKGTNALLKYAISNRNS